MTRGQGRSACSLEMDDGKSCKPYTYHTYQSSWPLLMFSLCGYSLLYQSVVDVFFFLIATLLCPPPVLFVALVPINQWEFQDPKMEVLYHIRPYFVVIFTFISLI